jgi:SAM-dependent methyltransferase
MSDQPHRRALVEGLRRRRAVRLLEGRLRFGPKRYVAVGETNSNFWRPAWETVDLLDADYLCDLRREPLPFSNDSVDVLAASHVVEHLGYPQECGFFFREACRVLKKGGFIRVSTPDADRLIERYKVGDWKYFLTMEGAWRLQLILKGRLPPEALLMHNLFVEWFASFSGRLDTAGGPMLPKEIVDEKVNSLDAFAFSRWCVGQLPPGRVYAHVNVYTFDRLARELKEAGFSRVERREFDETADPLLKKHHLDREHDRLCSLYAEAFK